MTAPLAGRRVLVVEDDFFLADDLVRALRAAAAEVIGPAPSVNVALELLAKTDSLNGAVVDLNLQGEMAFPIADALIERGVPLVFATGYDEDVVPQPYSHIPRFEKPVTANQILAALFD